MDVFREQTPQQARAVLDDRWRQAHLGRLLGHAMRRFDERVLALMTHDAEVPLALSNLAARAQVGAAHVHITRHLSLRGSRLTELAHHAGMTKQAMGDLVTQCEAWGLVQREPDPLDRRARRIVFTPAGLLWLDAFRRAVAQAEQRRVAQSEEGAVGGHRCLRVGGSAGRRTTAPWRWPRPGWRPGARTSGSASIRATPTACRPRTPRRPASCAPANRTSSA